METQNRYFNSMEIDTIGEILNISMGSAATTVSTMLDKRVLITTPNVQVIDSDAFAFDSLEPAIGVEINYIDGLSGTNVMILKESDVKAIVSLLMQTDFGDDFQMDELAISAICEVMNQMMGASSTVLSQFLNRPINISTPSSFSIDDVDEFKQKYYTPGSDIVCVKFKFMIENIIDSEFVSVMSVDLARELVSLFDDQSNPAEPEPQLQPQQQPQPQQQFQQQEAEPVQYSQPQQYQEQQSVESSVISNADLGSLDIQMEKKPAEKPTYKVQKPVLTDFSNSQSLSGQKNSNLDLIMSVPLQITVEIGRTKKQIKDILELTNGSIIELNKQAGAQVDIFVNGQLIAKGDVVVVEELYGVRITEILNKREILEKL